MKKNKSHVIATVVLLCTSFLVCSCSNLVDCVTAVDNYLAATGQNKVIVHFDANGGSGTMADQEIPATYTRKLSANAFTRDYYAFAGWSTYQNATEANFGDGASITPDAGNITLYAVWAQSLPNPSTLSYTGLIAVPAATGDSYTQATSSIGGFAHNISAFSLGKYEVTYELYYVVWQWALNHGYTLSGASEGNDYVTTSTTFTSIGIEPLATGKYKPAVSVSWAMCVVWCNAYSEMMGYAPVYFTDSACTVPIRDASVSSYENLTAGTIGNPYAKWGANGFRLPTAGEWQYAASCKGIYGYNTASGADAEYTVFTGAIDTDGDGTVRYTADVAVYNNTATVSSNYCAVGTKAPNIWGFYDMSGNADEWCYDSYSYSIPPTTSKSTIMLPVQAVRCVFAKGVGLIAAAV